MKRIMKKLDFKLLIGLLVVLIGVAETARHTHKHKCKVSRDIRSYTQEGKRGKRSEKWFMVGLVVADSDATESSHNIRREYTQDVNFTMVSRTEWGARLPQDIIPLKTPVPYVVIHHSYLIGACKKRKDCIETMRDIQDYHMDYRGWWDIGYNFAVGGDGAAYEGRGWAKMGAHALHWNNISIGICVIGDWSVCTPPEHQLTTVQALIAAGVELGFIKRDYQLIGHHQTRNTTKCPGDALYREIQRWTHWTENPVKDSNQNGTAEEEY